MNILFLNISTANPMLGGVQCVSYNLYKYFISQGHHVVMLAWKKTIEDSEKDFAICLIAIKFSPIEMKSFSSEW